MSTKLKCFNVLFFIFTLFFFIPSVSHVLGTESEAVLMVSQAEDSLEAAYLSVLNAERAGGDVSELVSLLNAGLEYYFEAERALEFGEYENAVKLAGEVVEASNLVLNADVILVFFAERVEEKVFWNQLFLSIVSVCFIFLFGFFSWRQFKGYYIRRVMVLRPEVVDDEY